MKQPKNAYPSANAKRMEEKRTAMVMVPATRTSKLELLNVIVMKDSQMMEMICAEHALIHYSIIQTVLLDSG